MSAHICPVVKLGPEKPIPGADKIVLFEIPGSGPVVSMKGQFKEGDLATFIPPETMVDTSLAVFSFLAKNARKSDGWAKIKPVRLRGQLSVGILVPPAGDEGANGADKYRVKKIEDLEVKVEQHNVGKKQTLISRIVRWIRGPSKEERSMWPGIPVYDINQLYKMRPDTFDPEELMVVTEKLHGTNARYVIDKTGKFRCGSRTMWRMHDGSSVYSRAASEGQIESKLRRLAEPLVLWGEIVGPSVQKGFDYGRAGSEIGFYAFDFYHAVERRFLDPDESKNICHWLKIQFVPIVSIERWNDCKDHLLEFASGMAGSMIGMNSVNHPREGVVVRPWKNVKETHALDGSRCLVAGKVINPAYLEFREKPGMDEQIIL